jgi:hypothetical protein
VRRISDFPWRVGKLGGVCVVLIATGVIVYFVMTGNPQPDSQQDAIRGYYESALGGHVPPKAASELRDAGPDCDRVVYDAGRRAFVLAPAGSP